MKDVNVDISGLSDYLILLFGGVVILAVLWWVYSYFNNVDTTMMDEDRDLFNDNE